MRLFALAVLALGATSAFAADPPTTTLTPQQQKMKDCNAQAGDKKGDERNAFMSNCLKATPEPAKMTQQEKMKACNVKAGEKKGDERKSFMSECLKGGASPS